MLKWIESTGRTEDAAIDAALTKLGLDRDEVSVEVLERAKSGFLGIGSNPAKVKVSYEEPEEAPAPVEKLVEKPVPEQKASQTQKQKPAPVRNPVLEEKPTPIKKAPPRTEKSYVPTKDLEGDDRGGEIISFLTGLMTHMGVDATPQVVRDETGTYQVDLIGQELGSLIGRRGETLDAIQQLTGYAVNHGQAHRVRVHVDAENYRAKREESLERLAQKVAGKVVKYRRNVTLEPMNAYERHVIHAALQEVPDVSTYSIGSEPNRRTVVAYSRGEQK